MSRAALPAATSMDPTCRDVLIMGVAGSGQSGFGREVQIAVDELSLNISSKKTVRSMALNYPAASIDVLKDDLAIALLLQSPWNYFASVGDGTVSLINHLSDEALRCPDEKWVLVGYSQGALVINQTSSFLSSWAWRISGVIMIADPARTATSGRPNYGNAQPGNGITVALPAYPAAHYSSALSGLTVDVCNEVDVVCDFSNLSLAGVLYNKGTEVHSGYTTSTIQLATAPATARAIQAQPAAQMFQPQAVSTGYGKILVSWSPARERGLSVTAYRLILTSTDVQFPRVVDQPANATSATISDLRGGSTYSITISAMSGYQSSLASPPFVIKVPPTPPEIIYAPTLKSRTTTSLTLSWGAPSFDGGSPLTGYRITAEESPTTVGGKVMSTVVPIDGTRSGTIGGLKPGTFYHVVVDPCNAVGCAENSEPNAFMTEPKVFQPPKDAGSLIAVSPSRLLDTRASAAVGADSTVSFQVGGVNGVPADVSAVVFNLTVTEAKSFGFVTAYASGTARPNASNVNFAEGQTVPNSVTVPVGADGKVTLFNRSSGSVQLIADVSGYYLPGTPTAPGTFQGIGPSRLLDTRASAAVGADSTVSFQVGGVNGVPADVSAVVFNLTVTEAKSFGFVTAYASGTARPNASNVNFAEGQTVPNSVTVPVGADGKVTLFNRSSGSVQLIADVSGYYLPGTPTAPGTFQGIGPSRLLDTRASAAVGADSTVSFLVGGVNGVPADVSAVVFNLTVTEAKSFGFVTAYASGTARPNASNVNFAEGQTVPNSVTVPVGADGKVTLFNRSSGSVQLIADVSGYYLR
ncbi:fibronectin type III domain-containing protein [Arthrobacter sp. M4]|uniref:fibronectin type III domain-containing protein n=1 Tax=Arthrobacter sp. M4 TaxID=218160 RepID=UPI001CDBD03E|nr:fibronectin type III domain-containing protein [Arthrobacter sp. M4]MCA4133050.1 fibronectin type III domain-containing protein [Arthrobacter sp. M4]